MTGDRGHAVRAVAYGVTRVDASRAGSQLRAPCSQLLRLYTLTHLKLLLRQDAAALHVASPSPATVVSSDSSPGTATLQFFVSRLQ